MNVSGDLKDMIESILLHQNLHQEFQVSSSKWRGQPYRMLFVDLTRSCLQNAPDPFEIWCSLLNESNMYLLSIDF